MADEIKVKIQYGGKEVEKVQVVPGLVKTGNAYLVRCSQTGLWTYCNEERLAKLTARYGGKVENVGTEYVGRAGKREVKIDTPAEPPASE